MSAQANAAMAQQLYAAFSRGDLDTCVANAAEDMVTVLIPFGQTFQGQSGFREFMESFKRAFPDLKITVTHQIATENQVVSECSWTGTHSGPLQSPMGEIPPTHKKVNGATFCEVWELRDGKLTHLRNYQDSATWMRQLGLVS